MKLEIINTLNGFLSLEKDWNRLLRESKSEHICLSFEWFRSWWIAFGKDKQLLVIIIRDDTKKISAIAPLIINYKKNAKKWYKSVGFMENSNSSCNDFIVTGDREKNLELIMDFLDRIRDKWDVIDLRNIPKDSPNHKIIENLLLTGKKRFGIKKGLRSPFLKIDTKWENYLSNRSKKFRKTLRNRINRIKKTGTYSIEKIENGLNSTNILNDIFEISGKSWKARYNQQITNTEENKRFFEEIFKTSSEKGWLLIWIFKIKGTPVAYEYHLRCHEKVYALKADFHENYRNLSPGSVLDTHIIKDYFDTCVQEYDLGGHEDLYKKNWTSFFREHSNFVIYNNTLKGKFLYFFDFKTIYPVKITLKKFGFLRKIKRLLLRRL